MMAAKLRFVGHSGELWQPKLAPARSMFIPDANLVLTLLNNLSTLQALPKAYRHFLQASRVLVRLQWHDRAHFIPVSPSLAVLELSKQDEQLDFQKYLKYYQDLMLRVYQIDNVDSRWIENCYVLACNLMKGELHSIQQTVRAALQYMPSTVGSNDDIVRAVDRYCGWLEDNFHLLTSLGGPSLFVPVLAFAGSQEARWILKVDKLPRSTLEDVSRNVAWDFMYFIYREIAYLGNQYKNDIFCTADDALAQLLLMKIHKGPRFSLARLKSHMDIPTGGHLYPLPCARIEGSSKLSQAIEERLNALWQRCSSHPDVVRMGFEAADLGRALDSVKS
ncbi:hypothetical protein [Casimicrobium huifangae]|uniref:hypothetical protein n=1 Tax=Casimicrobium huifangae TaxID=2591109 RepID=UPI0012EC396F|nr:hypothetical protein [Casimicrobium huifangae]